MEGLEISEVSFIYVVANNEVFRFDSNYFQKEFIREESIIRNRPHKTLKELNASLLSFGAYSLNNFVEYKSEGVPFIRGVNMKGGRIDFSNMIYIDASTNKLLWKSEVKPETVLLSMSGTIGDVALASKKWKYPINSNQDIAKINTNGNLNPYFLFAFLLGKFGQNYLKREARGSVQQHVFLSQMELFEIPLTSNMFEKRIQHVVEISERLLHVAEEKYSKAETLLLETLGLKDFEPSKEPVNIKSFTESFGASGRLDAEYYQKKYDELEAKIKLNSNFQRICDIRTYNFRGLQPVYVENGDLDVINSKHILEKSLDYGNFEKTSSDSWDIQKRARIFKGDILTYTTGANIGRTQVYDSEKQALASNHVNILRTKKEYNSTYIGFVMNSGIGRMQTEKFCAGSAQVELYPKDIDNFLIPIIDTEEQEKIVNYIEESNDFKIQSEQLLELAKTAVEKAIEENETVAMAYIQEELKKIEVELP